MQQLCSTGRHDTAVSYTAFSNKNNAHWNNIASFPVPRPAFRRLQYGKAGRAWYIFSREYDVIEKWQNFQNEDATFCMLFNHLHVQRSVSTTVAPPLARYVWYFTSYLRSSCCSETHVRPRLLPVFLPLSTLDVTHVRRCTRPSPLYRTASDEKLGVGLGTRLGITYSYVTCGFVRLHENVSHVTKYPWLSPFHIFVHVCESLGMRLAN